MKFQMTKFFYFDLSKVLDEFSLIRDQIKVHFGSFQIRLELLFLFCSSFSQFLD